MSKFASIEAEAAYVVMSHGFAEDEFGDSVDGSGYNFLAYVDAQTLMNLGEDDVRFNWQAAGYGRMGALIWARESTDGFVTTEAVAPTYAATDTIYAERLRRDFEAVADED